MTSSSPSPDDGRTYGEAAAGFARHDNEGSRLPLTGVFSAEMPAPRGGVFMQDMPTGKPPARTPRKIKGLPAATTDGGGEGTWSEVT